MNIRVGFFGKTHGIHGEIRLMVFPETGWAPKPGAEIECITKTQNVLKKKILEFRKHQEFFLVTLDGITTPEDARQFTDAEARATIDVLPQNSFFIKDLIGAAVHDQNNVFLGTITDVLHSSAHDFYVIDLQGRELLIPALKSMVIHFDPLKKELQMHVPEGFYGSKTKD